VILRLLFAPAKVSWSPHDTINQSITRDLDDARAELARARAQAHPGPGVHQRSALQAAGDSANARADGDRPVAARLLAEAVAHAVESKDGPVTAAVAELAAAYHDTIPAIMTQVAIASDEPAMSVTGERS